MISRGFTLIELLAVVLIMGVLTAIAVPQYRSSIERSRIAEAMQMLPAIFDSRERLMEEQQVINDKAQITFPRLDMDMKGRVATPEEVPAGDTVGHYWITDSFKYRLFDQEQGGATENKISAELKRGKFAGAVLYFDGNRISCCKKTSAEATTCDILNVPELRHGC
ncbi:type IV pilin protein [Candidatus Avelusimicrobium caledoniensis]|uniref:type IV pilin protein n=1 Tax=Candidatus Avelusimicrobium caledoniensis TaxID=3416220 RepID=UPI003D0E2AF9